MQHINKTQEHVCFCPFCLSLTLTNSICSCAYTGSVHMKLHIGGELVNMSVFLGQMRILGTQGVTLTKLAETGRLSSSNELMQWWWPRTAHMHSRTQQTSSGHAQVHLYANKHSRFHEQVWRKGREEMKTMTAVYKIPHNILLHKLSISKHKADCWGCSIHNIFFSCGQ